MYLGLDLRGGVHFLLQVDMQGALSSRYDALVTDLRVALRDQRIESTGVERDGMSVVLSFGNAAARDRAITALRTRNPDLQMLERTEGTKLQIVGRLSQAPPQRYSRARSSKNITTLHNRINELGVAEPIIQQQGTDRIVVQLPGVQDVAKAKDILGEPLPRNPYGR